MNHLICRRVLIFLVCLAIFSWTEVLADTLDHWQWRNPLPQGNSLNAVAYGDNMFVAVGGNGTIITSSDGVVWTIRSSGTINDLYAITYNNNTFVAVGHAGAVVTSADGIHWIVSASGTINDLTGITYGNNKFVAVGSNGTILTSSNGEGWTTQASGTNGNLYCIAYGNGTFVVGGENNLTSPDGLTWTIKSFASPFGYYNIRSIIYYNNSFVASATQVLGEGWYSNMPVSYIITSPDGMTWTVSNSLSNGIVKGFVHGNDKFVAVGFGGNGGYGATFTSSDGTAWLEQACSTCGFGNLLNGIGYGNNTYVAVGYQGIILVSSDGVTWTASNSNLLRSDAGLYDITYGSAGFVTVGSGWIWNTTYEDLDPMQQGYIPLLSSSDGSVWVVRHFGVSWSRLNAVAYGNNTYVAVGREGIIITSTDGVTWTQTTSGTNLEMNAVAYGKGTFVTVGSGRTALISSNGIDWTKITSENIDIPNYMVYGGGLFIAVGYGGMIITSPDGITWTQRVSGTTEELNGISYGKSTFVSVGNAGTILTSPDGLTWTTRTSGATNDLTGVAFGNNTFAVVGASGNLITSSDGGSSWVVRNSVAEGSPYGLYRVAFGNGTFVAVGAGSEILQSALHNTIPDQFTFFSQTGAGLNKAIASNTITVSGIDVAVPISITGGTYSINGGSYTSADGTVYNGDAVTIQVTSSGSYSTTTNATLFIGEVYRYSTFNVTTQSSLQASLFGDGGSKCFIATAAFGSPIERHVQILRDFRDRYLLNFKLGQEFVKLYYRISPPIAETIAKSEVLRKITRWCLMPVIGVAYLTFMFGVIPTLLLVTISFLTPFLFIRLSRKRFRQDLRDSSAI